MTVYPSMEEIKAFAAQGYRKAPVAYETLSDGVTPIALLRRLKKKSAHCYILESVQNQEFWGRYTFLGYDPALGLSCMNGRLLLKDRNGALVREENDASPAKVIRELLTEYRSPRIEGMPSFTGGLVGYFAYDYIKYNEPKLRLDAADADGFQDVDLMLFDKVVAFDNVKQKLICVANMELAAPDGTSEEEREAFLRESYEGAKKELREMLRCIQGGEEADIPRAHVSSDMRPLFGREAFCEMVERAKRHIREGDVFQVVLSNRLEAEFEGSLFDVYRTLRTVNPSPYMFYFSGDDIEVAGASPETLVKLENGTLRTFPLAGTRPRGRSAAEDTALEKELLSDEKERAEHNMLVDLGRNDLGRISAFGTVEVERYMQIERYSHVMHIGSTVRGRLREGLTAIDAIDAVLPAGTLSGAPKIRACEIINELEDNKRGVYGGAVGYLDFTGNMDTCIAIRLAFLKNGKIFVRSGAGIVADSVPEKEYEECLNKAKAVMKAVAEAETLGNGAEL